ncbi:hypothetical protein SPRG_04748 [Saprolegnia parasitica CBS 223.65]|uniref:Uncharacterized protein n=1 Tax=Saprolegnia parasitica (strain CBS 223.65) TaxID=695850 RepID=A0A067CVL9_SAPPC|nr:hypothetical protein SPRG_04748 [Saprolegnia parasitica CBS 223.65]KDO30847.1 hypothetical protein SPRG_04748 [Saprolegnia parasitica CBS 223.65]|eukprot:XP_012198544.1 hypothetical protein SPRG_04748 [Saprolegnia parasitica CBS 223.65]
MDRRPAKSMFDAGISSKFSRQYIGALYEDTTLNAATAARVRAERKLQAQEDAIERQRLKIDLEIQKIQDAKKTIQRKKLREAKRVEARCHNAAAVLQAAARRFLERRHRRQAVAATTIASVWRMRLSIAARHVRATAAATITHALVHHVRHRRRHLAARCLQTAWRCYRALQGAKLARQAHWQQRQVAATKIQSVYRMYVVRETFLDVVDAVIRFQALYRGFVVRRLLPPAEPQVDEPDTVVAPSPRPLPSPWTPGKREIPTTAAILDYAELPGSPMNKVVLPSLLKPSTARREVPEARAIVPPKQLRQRRKTIAVTLSPMPYQTVLIQRAESATASPDEDELKRRMAHAALRRKVLQQQCEEKQRQMEKRIKQSQLEREALERSVMQREERRCRVLAKTDVRHRVAAARRAADADRQIAERETAGMEKEERQSRLASKWLLRVKTISNKPRSMTSNNQVDEPKVAARKQRPPQQPKRPKQKTLRKRQSAERDESDALWADDAFDDLVDETQLNGLLVL